MRRTKRIILIGVESHYGHEIVTGINSYCREHEPWEYYLGRDNSYVMLQHARVALAQWKPDGIIAHIQNDPVERFVRNSGLPAVNVTGVKDRKVPTVISDTTAVGRLGARHFLENGFRNFAFGPLTPEVSVRRRWEGFSREVADAGFPCSAFAWPYKGWQDSYWVKNRKKMSRWLMRLKKPLALMCAYDPFAPTLIFMCQHAGFRVPEDVAILGAGNEEFYCKLSTPQLSSVDLNVKRIGHEAARLLDKLMRGGKAPAKPILIPPWRVVRRQSSDTVAVEDPDIAAAMRFIRDHAHQPMSVKDLLREVPLCRKTLDTRFLKLIGRTCKSEIMRVRLEHAKQLLSDTDQSMAAVAERSGFINQEVFSVSFHREVGVPPTKYRQTSRAGAENVAQGSQP